MLINKKNEKNSKKSENLSKKFYDFIHTHLLSILMSGYSSDGVLSISTTSDNISTKNRDQSLLSWNDKEKSQPELPDCTKHEKKPWYVKYVKCKYESDMDIAVQGTTSL